MDVRQFAFTVDSDTEKLITITQNGSSVDVSVRFSGDVLHETRNEHLEIDGILNIVSDEHGLTLSYSCRWLGLRIGTKSRRY